MSKSPLENSIAKYCNPTAKRKIMAGETPAWMHRAKRGRYIIRATLSFPLWMTKKELAELIVERDRLSAVTGEPYVLDHIIPIDHPRVSGLSVPWNIQPIPHRVNAVKSNTWNPDQVRMFE